MNKILRNKLKKIDWLRKIVRFYRSSRLPSYLKVDYFDSYMPYQNKKSINGNDVIIVGSFKSEKYYLRSSPKRLIENAAHFYGVWESSNAEFIYSVLNKGYKDGIVIDIGANIGATTIPQAIKFSNLKFICVEAHPVIFKRMEENIAINRISNIESINKAVSNSKTGTQLTFFAQDSNSENLGLSSLTLNHDIEDFKEISVETVRIDDLVSETESKTLLIKIDTQGGELDVLYSAANTIIQDHPIVIFEFEEEYHSNPGQIRSAISDFFKEKGYQLFTAPTSNNVMYKLNLNDYYHGDIVAFPIGSGL